MKNPYPWGTQKYRLLNRLQLGPILNSEIVDNLRIFNYRDAICEIRKDLAGQCVELVANPVNRKRNHWQYRLVLPGQQPLL
jgi:hypothetical protein